MIEKIESFYESFKNLDIKGMVSLYHDDVSFQDPAFGLLHGDRAKNMWRMLLKSLNGKDFHLEYFNVKETNSGVSAEWNITYPFGKKDKIITNSIHSEFQFSDGLILIHKDTFDLKRWSGQAFGISGKLLGNTGFFKKKLQKQTSTLLDKFESKYSSRS